MKEKEFHEFFLGFSELSYENIQLLTRSRVPHQEKEPTPEM